MSLKGSHESKPKALFSAFPYLRQTHALNAAAFGVPHGRGMDSTVAVVVFFPPLSIEDNVQRGPF